MKRFLLLLFPLFFSGCLYGRLLVGSLGEGGVDSSASTNEVQALFEGVVDYRTLWLGNDKGVKTPVAFSTLDILDEVMADKLNLNESELAELRKRAEKEMRDYLTDCESLNLLVHKRVAGRGIARMLLDVHRGRAEDSLLVRLCTDGLCVLNEDSLDLCNYNNLLKLQNRAQNLRLGVWKNAYFPNSNWNSKSPWKGEDGRRGHRQLAEEPL